MTVPLEINLRRLLSRLQARLAHAERIEDEDRVRLWSFVATSRELLETLGVMDGVSEDALAGYQRKLAFVSEVLSASEGRRPAVVATVAAVVDREEESTSTKRLILGNEESVLRAELLGQDHLRKRLGLAPAAKKEANEVIDPASEMATRDQLAGEVLLAMKDLKDNTLLTQVALASDNERLKAVGDTMSTNLDGIGEERKRMDATISSTSGSCYTYCAMISFVLCVFLGTLLFMRIMPVPRR
jgi:hypothetical protein